MNIRIARSAKYHLWTVYYNGKGIAGLTSPPGFFIGQLVVGFLKRRIVAQYKGQRLL